MNNTFFGKAEWIRVTDLHQDICEQISKAIHDLEKTGHLIGYPQSITYLTRNNKEYTLPFEYDKEK